ncbi:MAG: DUF1599 domain-containing protein [Paludibacteraceae bacterium]|nr:DUF1599 domain-containing protein [Paludibacteraceae bacterium]MBQ9704851.1 DUF1599 domain-containing protein [Paludibacteraceae bacterium]
MSLTEQQYDNITAQCRSTFLSKMEDYGPSWRTMRPVSIVNQLFIKAKRIREIEQTGVNLVGEDTRGEFMAIVNYAVMGLIQQECGFADTVDMTAEEATVLYDKYIAEARALMLRKNHDYGEAWREMDSEAITDLIYNKILRNKTIIRHGGKTIVSEGVEGNYFDMLNYAVFNLIKLEDS